MSDFTQEQREKLREKVAAQHGVRLYKRYSEKAAALAIGFDYSTLKRKRRVGLVPFVDVGGGTVGYMGYHIADIILFGVKAKGSWEGDLRGENFSAATGGSARNPADPGISAASSTAARSPASALALATLMKQRRA